MSRRDEQLNHKVGFDDLTIIKGIGQARQQWLRDHMSVRTMGDLAALTANDIEALLRAEGRIISRGEIDGWLEEARRFATSIISQQPSSDVPTAPDVESQASPHIAASFVIEVEVSPQPNNAPAIKTIVHHIESDVDETWDALLPPAMLRWMLERSSIGQADEIAALAWDEQPAEAASGKLQFGAFSDRLVALMGRAGDPVPAPTPPEVAMAAPSQPPATQVTSDVYHYSPRLQELLGRSG